MHINFPGLCIMVAKYHKHSSVVSNIIVWGEHWFLLSLKSITVAITGSQNSATEGYYNSFVCSCYAGQPLVTTTIGLVTTTQIGIIIDPAIAENQVPEGQNADVNFVSGLHSGVPGPEQSCIKLLLLFMLSVFIIVLY
jgi:hypothetical protein